MAAETSGSKSSSAADSYIGSLISLTSKSEIRYEGALYNINPEESSIGLINVRSFGTEGRKKDGPQVPPSDKVYEYILFRGSDIKDLQVKASPPPPVQPMQAINNDPAIIQSHYPRPLSTSNSLPSAVSGSMTNLNSHNTQVGGLHGPGFQGGLPLYQPGGNLGSWGAPPPPRNANGSGLAMPTYWPGYYAPPPNGLPQLHQQSLLQPPPGLSIPASLQQPMQYLNFNAPFTTAASSLQISNSLETPSLVLPLDSSSPSLATGYSSHSTLTSALPSLPSTLPPVPSSSLASDTSASSLPDKAPISSLPTLMQNSSLLPLFVQTTSRAELSVVQRPISNKLSVVPGPILLPESTSVSTASVVGASNSVSPETSSGSLPDKTPITSLPSLTQNSSLPSLSLRTISSAELSVFQPPISNNPSVVPGPILLPQSTSMPTTSVVGASDSVGPGTSKPSLVTPGQLLQSGSIAIPASQPAQTTDKDVEVVQVSSSAEPEQSAQVTIEAQPQILPLPVHSRNTQKPNGAPFETYNGYRGRGRGRGRGRAGRSYQVMKFTEDFDFTAMNEKFNKDEVWGHLGKSSKGDGKPSDEDDYQDEDDADLSFKPVYKKDDFFDTLSCSTLDRESQNGRPKFSELRKLDTETFGEFSRYRGGRGGGRGYARGGGRARGGYHGRSQGYGGRGQGRDPSNRG